MVDHSALDREGAGSNPASGFHPANPSYAVFQLARALTTAHEHDDPDTRERAKEKATKWQTVFEKMLNGSLEVGTRTPVPDTPEWVTLEVVTGGFATGAFLAGGPLTDHERALTERLALRGNDIRLQLNRYFLTDQGLSELQDALRSGRFEIDVPEEGALLVVAWLLINGHAQSARDLLDRIAPFFTTLRFFPLLVDRPRRFGSRVFIQDVKTTIRKLDAIPPNQAILTQREALQVWTPLYDELVALLLETVEGDPPALRRNHAAGGSEDQHVSGGWPCQQYSNGWPERAQPLLQRIRASQSEHKLSAKPSHRKSNFAQLIPLFEKCVTDPASLSGREVGRIRLSLARYVAKRGLPNGAECRQRREKQHEQAQTPVYSDIAKAVVPRLRHFPGDQGLEQVDPVLAPLNADEARVCGLRSDSPLPEPIRRRIERCLCETVEILVERGLITSGDMLAEVLPQMTSGLRAAGIADPLLRQLYAAIYRAFRRRRSLLLLNLQSQVKIEELPWVQAVESFRREDISTRDLTRQTLEEVSCLALSSFPHAILPNKLLQEIRALAKGTAIDIPVVDELAADIFMGEFSPKFLAAAKIAADLLADSLYARYYGVDYAEIQSLPDAPKSTTRRWPFSLARSTTPEFAGLCMSRAGVKQLSWDPATNGMVIEQQQILTTQNLAPLFVRLNLTDLLEPQLPEMARVCFDWICRRLQVKATKWHARLIMVKNTAYAWRQMVFYLSLLTESQQAAFLSWADEQLASQRPAFRDTFQPALDGLRSALQGDGSKPGGKLRRGRQFLGWSKKKHWLLEGRSQ